MDRTTVTLETRSEAETERLGRTLAPLLPIGAVVALRGDLAAGKTCLVRGMAAHFGANGLVHSPTFTLVNEYGTDPKLYHMDLYRLGGPEELADLGYEELFEPDGVCAVEWSERAGNLLPDARLEVLLEHGGEDLRRITFHDYGVLPDGWFDVMTDALRSGPAG
ncbi:MAG: tRNA (adenosine(37)-N6)-threonylcarbamoyltransferase complex ATPase subunit type 1 TsaE [bacterium]|nr:tRNA (adenosine(37)-N6)-threonylcarbamoyltransferase complex ATPase subunit type 1 TsaE [bacterium]